MLTPGSSDDAAFGQRVRAYLLEHPEVLQEMAANLGHGLDQLDIEAERSRYEQQVQASSRRYHEILETSIDGFWLVDLETGSCRDGRSACRRCREQARSLQM